MPIPTLKNRVGMTVSGTPGTGPITLGVAINDAVNGDYISCAEAYGADATLDILVCDGHNTTVEREATYNYAACPDSPLQACRSDMRNTVAHCRASRPARRGRP